MTHYYLADRRPFLNLSDLAEPQMAAVLAELATPEQQPLSPRRFGPRYMALRQATERRARDLFIAAAGSPNTARRTISSWAPATGSRGSTATLPRSDFRCPLCLPRAPA